MKKNNKIIAVLAIAVVLAIAAAVCIIMVLSPQRTKIYVFNDSYKAGTALTQKMLTTVEVDSSVIVAKSTSSTDNFFITDSTLESVLKNNDSLKMDVSDGMPLMKSMLSVTGGNTIEMNMSPSKIALSVSINNVTGVTSELTAGSSVNVYVIKATGSSYLLFENMRLLDVSKSSSSDTLSTATLEVSNAQALKLLDAMTTGDLYLGLVNSSGYQYTLGSDEKQEAVTTAAGTQEKETQETSASAEKEPETTAQSETDEAVTAGENTPVDVEY